MKNAINQKEHIRQTDRHILEMEVDAYSLNEKANAYFASDYRGLTVNELISKLGGIYAFKRLFILGSSVSIWQHDMCDHVDVLLRLKSVKTGKEVCPKGVLQSYNRHNGVKPRKTGFRIFRYSGYRSIRHPSVIAEIRAAEAMEEWGFSKRRRRITDLKNSCWDNIRACNHNKNWKEFRKTQYKRS